MTGLDSILGWLAIGAAASLAAMTMPFMRGSSGVVAKLVTGLLGAVLGGAISRWLVPDGHEPSQLLFAAVGSVVALFVVQVFYQRHARAHTPAMHH